MENEHAETQTQILDAAMRHFAEHGYRGTSLAKIAEEAGVSKSLIFWYFESKNRLFHALIDHFVRSCREHLANSGPAGDARSKIENMIDTFWTFIGRNLWFVRIFINWFMQLERRDKEKTSAVREIHKEFQRIFVEYLQEGKEQGLFREDLVVSHAGLFLVSTLEGTLLQLLIEDINYEELQKGYFQSLKTNLMDGLIKKD